MVNRLREIRTKLHLTQQSMAKHLGIGKSAMSMIETGKAALSERNKNILVQNLNINPTWLDTGQGEMFLSSKSSPKNTLKGFDRDNAIPLYNIDSNYGLTKILQKSKKTIPSDYIFIPNISKCDGAIYLVGDSMYPQIKPGDIVIYATINPLNDLFWGETYLLSLDIEGQEYSTIRILQKSEKPDYINLVSSNPIYQDKEIHTSKIKAIALIKATINMR